LAAVRIAFVGGKVGQKLVFEKREPNHSGLLDADLATSQVVSPDH
jgi:hypothetical protein